MRSRVLSISSSPCYQEAEVHHNHHLGASRNGEDDAENTGEDEVGNVNYYSEISRETLCGSPYLSRVDTFGDGDGASKSEAFWASNRPELEIRQLNAESLAQMEKNMANGDFSLHAELLCDNPTLYGRLPRERRTVSVVTVPPDTDGETADSSLIKLDSRSSFAPLLHGKMTETSSGTLFCSVDSVCGSSAAPNTLNRRNLDRIAYQLRFGTSTLKPEMLHGECICDFDRTSGVPTNDEDTSVWVEGGSEWVDEFRSQCDTTGGASNEAQKCAISECCCDEASGNSILPKGSLDPRRESAKEIKLHIAHGGPYGGLMPERKISRSMAVEVGSLASPVGGSQMPDGGLMFSGFLVKEKYEDSMGKESLHGSCHRPVQLVQVMGGRERENGLGRSDSVSEEVPHLQQGLPIQVSDLRRQLRSTKAKVAELRATLRANTRTIETHVAELNRDLSATLASEVNAFKWKLMEEMRDLWDYMKNQMGVAPQTMKSQTGVMDDRTFQEDTIFPAEKLPDGQKTRLIVDIHLSSERREVLLPISVNATVGMCKRELLRRLRQQGLIDGEVCDSDVYLLRDTLTLYEGDVLADVLAPIFQESGASVNSARLSLHATQPKRTHSLLQGSVKMLANTLVSTPSRPTTCGDNTDGNGEENLQSATSLLEALLRRRGDTNLMSFSASGTLLKQEGLGGVGVESVDEVQSNEVLHRRLVFELERMARGELLRSERGCRTALVKDTLNSSRLLLLDRATHASTETDRRAARSALQALEGALLPGTSVEEMRLANNAAQSVIESIAPANGENERVALMWDALHAEQERRRQTVEEIRELAFDVAHTLRIPPTLLGRAESLAQDAERAAVMSPGVAQEELDAVRNALVEFCALVNSQS